MRTNLLQWMLLVRSWKWPVWAALTTGTMIVVLGGFSLWQRHAAIELSGQVSQLRSRSMTFDRADSKPPQDAADLTGQRFETILGNSEEVPQYLRTIFRIAGKQAISLPQGSYKAEPASGYKVYTIDFPVHGDYTGIKTVCEQILLALPFSAVEEIVFKRESISDATVETHLRFALFLKSSGSVQENKTGAKS